MHCSNSGLSWTCKVTVWMAPMEWLINLCVKALYKMFKLISEYKRFERVWMCIVLTLTAIGVSTMQGNTQAKA